MNEDNQNNYGRLSDIKERIIQQFKDLRSLVPHVPIDEVFSFRDLVHTQLQSLSPIIESETKRRARNYTQVGKRLNQDVWSQIFSYLRIRILLKFCSLVCKDWKAIIYHHPCAVSNLVNFHTSTLEMKKMDLVTSYFLRNRTNSLRKIEMDYSLFCYFKYHNITLPNVSHIIIESESVFQIDELNKIIPRLRTLEMSCYTAKEIKNNKSLEITAHKTLENFVINDRVGRYSAGRWHNFGYFNYLNFLRRSLVKIDLMGARNVMYLNDIVAYICYCNENLRVLRVKIHVFKKVRMSKKKVDARPGAKVSLTNYGPYHPVPANFNPNKVRYRPCVDSEILSRVKVKEFKSRLQLLHICIDWYSEELNRRSIYDIHQREYLILFLRFMQKNVLKTPNTLRSFHLTSKTGNLNVGEREMKLDVEILKILSNHAGSMKDLCLEYLFSRRNDEVLKRHLPSLFYDEIENKPPELTLTRLRLVLDVRCNDFNKRLLCNQKHHLRVLILDGTKLQDKNSVPIERIWLQKLRNLREFRLLGDSLIPYLQPFHADDLFRCCSLKLEKMYFYNPAPKIEMSRRRSKGTQVIGGVLLVKNSKVKRLVIDRNFQVIRVDCENLENLKIRNLQEKCEVTIRQHKLRNLSIDYDPKKHLSKQLLLSSLSLRIREPLGSICSLKLPTHVDPKSLFLRWEPASLKSFHCGDPRIFEERSFQLPNSIRYLSTLRSRAVEKRSEFQQAVAVQNSNVFCTNVLGISFTELRKLLLYGVRFTKPETVDRNVSDYENLPNLKSLVVIENKNPPYLLFRKTCQSLESFVSLRNILSTRGRRNEYVDTFLKGNNFPQLKHLVFDDECMLGNTKGVLLAYPDLESLHIITRHSTIKKLEITHPNIKKFGFEYISIELFPPYFKENENTCPTSFKFEFPSMRSMKINLGNKIEKFSSCLKNSFKKKKTWKTRRRRRRKKMEDEDQEQEEKKKYMLDLLVVSVGYKEVDQKRAIVEIFMKEIKRIGVKKLVIELLKSDNLPLNYIQILETGKRNEARKKRKKVTVIDLTGDDSDDADEEEQEKEKGKKKLVYENEVEYFYGQFSEFVDDLVVVIRTQDYQCSSESLKRAYVEDMHNFDFLVNHVGKSELEF